MTDEMMSLRALIEKSPDADLLREMIGFAVQRLMKLEFGELAGAAYSEKSADRLTQHNGYCDRDWGDPRQHARARISKLRKGAHFPSFLELSRVDQLIGGLERHTLGPSARAR